MVKTEELPIDMMLPRIISVREFELKQGECRKNARKSLVYELGFYLSGNGSIKIGDKQYEVNFGDIRFVKPGTILSSKPCYKCYTITFDFGENNTVYKNQILENIPEYFSTTGELCRLFEDILKSFLSTDIHEKLRCKALLMQLLASLFEIFYTSKKYSDAVRLCVAYMEENYNLPITLEKLGELTGYSSIHTMRLFRRDTGQTPHEWLTAIRISRAKSLLTTSSKTIEEIADSCGFNSSSHFKVLFKRVCGITPGSFRKNTHEVY